MAKILLAAGGTGGHLFPAEALAQELLNRGHSVVIATDKRGHAFKSLSGDVSVHVVRAGFFAGGIAGKIKTVLNIAIGTLQSFVLLVKHKPDLVAGFGGYPSFPPVFAAQLARVPTMLHEQNGVLGKANIVLARRAKAIAASLPDTYDEGKTVVTGNPVRAVIAALKDVSYDPPAAGFRLFVTGGSQGASVLAEVVPQACALLPQDLRERLDVVQQARPEEAQGVRSVYEAAGIKAEVAGFFADMPERLKACHLFVGRSGASTVAEIAVVGRPAIFVPYPGHKDMQQKVNAETITRQGGGWIIMQPDFTPQALAAKLEELMRDPQILIRAAESCKKCGRPQATAALADVVENLLKGGSPHGDSAL